MKLISSLALAAALGAATLGIAVAQVPGPPGAGAAANRAPVHDAGKGPFETSVVGDLKDHAVYRPADITKVKGKMPIIGWGNGGCLATGLAHEPFLRKVASHGYFIVANGAFDARPPSLAGLAPGAPMPPAPRSQASEIIDGINWAIAENSRKDSPYYGKLDPSQIAVMGQSCGGMQAIGVSKDPRVKTSVIWNSGVGSGMGGMGARAGGGRPGGAPGAPGAPPAGMPGAPGAPPAGMPGAPGAPPAGMPGAPGAPPAGMPAGMPAGAMGMMASQATKEDLQKFHAPVAYFIGGPSDVAYNNAEEDFKVINNVPLFNANINVGHGGATNDPNAGWFGEVGVAWLDWQLKGDKKASKYFVGEQCTLCVDPQWTIKKKNIK